MNRILLLQIAGIGYRFLLKSVKRDQFGGIPIKPVQGIFPALTCPVQATLRTATLPQRHGIVGNGFFFREPFKPLFWEQSSRLMEGPRIWDTYRQKGGRVGQMFIQQSLGKDSDLVYSPAPIHKHHGGMIMDCAGEPESMCRRLRQRLGDFPLHRYWGPLASIKSSRWIARALSDVMHQEAPGLLYGYLPHMDYVLQKDGPDSLGAQAACRQMDEMVADLVEAAAQAGYRTLVFSDYAITPAKDVLYPNRLLKEHGWFAVRRIRNMNYPNFHASRAFCVADHQIGHVYILDGFDPGPIRQALETMEGVERVLGGTEKATAGMDHPRSGDLILIAKPGFWFDYRWWHSRKEAPDFAGHVDIHNKPGYDPCELCFGLRPFTVSQNPRRIRGTHGRVDADEPVFLGWSDGRDDPSQSLLELALNLRERLQETLP